MFPDVKNFILEKLWLPLLQEAPAYNIYNTALYALIFAAVTVYIIKPAIEKLDVDIDRKFFTALTPWIVLTGALSALNQLGPETILLEAPVLFSGLITALMATMYAGKKLEVSKNIRYDKTVFTIGILFLAGSTFLYSLENFQALNLSVIVTLLWLVPGLSALKVFRPDLISFSFAMPVGAHFLDATSTFVALRFGASEQHVVARYFIEILGPGGIFLLKAIAVIPIVLIIDKEMKGDEKMFYLFVISALGLGIASRNFLQIFAGL